jgi:hypothetical protein
MSIKKCFREVGLCCGVPPYWRQGAGSKCSVGWQPSPSTCATVSHPSPSTLPSSCDECHGKVSKRKHRCCVARIAV